MFVQLLFGLLFAGSIFIMLEMVLPGQNAFFYMSMKYIGVICIWMGPILYYMRSVIVGAIHFIEIPNPNKTILLNMGNSGAKLSIMEKAEMNSLRHRKQRLRYRDMGGGTRIAGHDFNLGSQTSGITYPIWVIDLVQQYKDKYGVRDEKELLNLYNDIRGITSHDDLYKISFLKPIMADGDKRTVLMNMSLDELRNMSELLYDGRTINIKSYLDFDERSSPYDNESIIARTLAHRAEQRQSYRFGASADYMKYVVPLAIILILGAVAYQIFKGS